MKHIIEKVKAGHYIYRNHHVRKEEDAEGPDGPRPPYWAISGEIGTPHEHSGHYLLPQLESLKACRMWLDAYLADSVRERQRVELEYWRKE